MEYVSDSMEEWTTKVNPSYLNWLTGLLPERRSPLTRVILHQLRKMQIGNKVEEAYFQLSRLKPTVVLEHLSSEKYQHLVKQSTSSSKLDHKKKWPEKPQHLVKQSTSGSQLDEKRKRSEKPQHLVKQSTSGSQLDEKRKGPEKPQHLVKQSTSGSQLDEKRKRSEKPQHLVKQSTSGSQLDEKRKGSEKPQHLAKKSTSGSQLDEKRKGSEKPQHLVKQSTSGSQLDEKRKGSEKQQYLVKQSTSGSQLDEKRKGSEKQQYLVKQSTSGSQLDEKRKGSEKQQYLVKQSTSGSQLDEKRKGSEKPQYLVKPSTLGSQLDKKRKGSEKSQHLVKQSTSGSQLDEKKKWSEKPQYLVKPSTSGSQLDEKRKGSEKPEHLIKRSSSSSKHDDKIKRRKLEHALSSKENVQGGTPRSNVDYTRNTPSLTPSEINHRWEDLHMTPPRKTASPFWKETPVKSEICTVSSHSADITSTSGVLKVALLKLVPDVSESKPNILLEKESKGPQMECISSDDPKDQENRSIEQEPDRKPVLLKLVPDVSESKPNILFEKESKGPQMECISSDDPKDQENRSIEQEPDRKPVLLKLVPDVSESKPNILFEKESKGPQMECISSDDPKDQENRSIEQEPDRKPVLLKLVPDVSESKPNILLEKESKGPQMECISSDDPKHQENRSIEQEPDRKPVLLKLVPDVSESKPNILLEKKGKGLVGILSEDPIDAFQVEKHHVSCQKRQVFRHFRRKYKTNQEKLVQFDHKNWSKSRFLKILTKEELVYQSEVEELFLKCPSFCAQYGTRDETASVSTVQAHQSSRLSSVSTVQAHQSSRLSSVSTVLNKAKQYPRHSVASMTVANHQLLQHSVRSVATAANRSHRPHFTNYGNPRYYSQPYPINWYRERYLLREHYPPYM